MISVGLLGEYVGAIHTQVQKRPYAIELERMNFEFEPALPKQDVTAGHSAELSAMNQALAATVVIERDKVRA
jgi:hypothetical protein